MVRKAGTFLAVAGSLALAVAAVPQFQKEYATVLFSRLTESRQFAALTETGISLPPSVRSERIVLQACDTSMRSVLALFQAQARRDALRGNCADLANAASARAPTSSLAQLLVASTAPNDAEFSRALAVSQATGAFEGDLAQRRFVLAADRIDRLAPEALAALSADITLLVQFPAGRSLVAERYLALPEAREVMTEAIERAPEQSQKAFIAAVRGAGR
jgi:hypothetical protein